MAESEMGGERTEEPSQRRLQEARERGQIPRSRELTNFATMIGGSAALVAIGGTRCRASGEDDAPLTARSTRRALRSTDSMAASLGAACMSAVTAILPVFGALIVMVVLASVALGGWNFSDAGADAGFFPPESAVGTEATVRTAWRLRAGEGAAQVLGRRRGVRGNRQLDFRRRAGSRAHGAARGGVARRRAPELGLRVAVRFARAGRRRGRAAAIVPVQARVCA